MEPVRRHHLTRYKIGRCLKSVIVARLRMATSCLSGSLHDKPHFLPAYARQQVSPTERRIKQHTLFVSLVAYARWPPIAQQNTVAGSQRKVHKNGVEIVHGSPVSAGRYSAGELVGKRRNWPQLDMPRSARQQPRRHSRFLSRTNRLACQYSQALVS